jgi:hypothetical protein
VGHVNIIGGCSLMVCTLVAWYAYRAAHAEGALPVPPVAAMRRSTTKRWRLRWWSSSSGSSTAESTCSR